MPKGFPVALLSARVGDSAEAVTRRAPSEGRTQRAAAIALGLTMADAYDRLVDPVAMTSAAAGRRRDLDA